MLPGRLARCRRPDFPLARGRMLVAGDAAALVDHWPREGISYALRSGNIAGDAATVIRLRAPGRILQRTSGQWERTVNRSV